MIRNRIKWYNRLRDEGAGYGEAWVGAGKLVDQGLAPDFQLPYPEPRNEYEDAMNEVLVNPVVSGRSGW